MTRVLVAGATGYLGQYIVAELKQQGCWVRALARPGKEVAGADEVFSARLWHHLFLRQRKKPKISNLLPANYRPVSNHCQLPFPVDEVVLLRFDRPFL